MQYTINKQHIQGFHKLTGYENEDVIGRNCRFLQGPDTTDDEKNPIREAIKLEQDCNVSLTNYKKDGTKFKNEVRCLCSVWYCYYIIICV